MEKEKILSTLTDKLGKTSLSSRSIETYVDNNLPAEGTEPDDAFWTKHVNVLKSFAGQYDHDFAVAVEDWKKQNPNTPPPPPTPPVTPPDDKYAKLEAEIAALKKAREEETVKLGVEKLRSNVLGKAGELKISAYKNIWDDVVNGADLSDCKTEDEALTKCKGEFERLVKRYYTDKAQPYGSTKQTPKHTETEQKKRREAYQAQLKAEGLIPDDE